MPLKSRSGGILYGVKLERFDVISFEMGECSIMANVFDKKLKKTIGSSHNIWAGSDEKREQFLIELSHICANRKAPMLIGGDFNIVRFSEEKNRNFHV